MAISSYSYRDRPNRVLTAVRSIIAAPLNVSMILLLSAIVLKPVHDVLESGYTSVNLVNRVRAWVPSISDFLPAVSSRVEVKGLTGEKKKNVEAIINQGKAMSMSDRDIKLALMTASQESSMVNTDKGDDWFFAQTGEGKSDSMGLFQQRDSWGNKQCRMNPECSAKLFYSALRQVTDRNTLPDWQAIAQVQRPAKQYEQEYQKWEGDAQSYLKATDNLKVSDSIKLPTFKDLDQLNWFDTHKDLELHPDKSIQGGYLLLEATKRRDEFGAVIYRLGKISNGKVENAIDAVSGFPGSTDRNNHVSGSGQPLPLGKYDLGQVEEGNFDPGIGSTWISLTPQFSTSRASIGLHFDANRKNSPGTAGCVGTLSEKDIQTVAQWVREGNVKTLVNR